MKINNPIIDPEKVIEKYLNQIINTDTNSHLLLDLGWKPSIVDFEGKWYFRNFIKSLPYPKLVELYYKLD